MVDVEVSLGRVDLVGNEDVRDLGAQQQPGDPLIVIGDLRRGIGNEDHHVRPVDGDLSLAANPHGQLLPRAELPATGVDQQEPPARPLRLELAAVAGHSGLLVDDGRLAAHDAVHQSRLADVGPSEHGNHGHLAHAATAATSDSADGGTASSGADAAAATSASDMSSRNTSPFKALSAST